MEGTETKACPRCGALLFADMDICYECLYEYERDGGADEADNVGDEASSAPSAESVREHADERWVEEEVPLEAYPEQVDAGLETQLPSGWVLRMSTDLVDASVVVPDRGLIIGRGQTCDVVLHARSVSRQHVRIEPDGEGICVYDLGARNPPLLNGKRLEGEKRMSAGDSLSVCGATFVLDAR